MIYVNKKFSILSNNVKYGRFYFLPVQEHFYTGIITYILSLNLYFTAKK